MKKVLLSLFVAMATQFAYAGDHVILQTRHLMLSHLLINILISLRQTMNSLMMKEMQFTQAL